MGERPGKIASAAIGLSVFVASAGILAFLWGEDADAIRRMTVAPPDPPPLAPMPLAIEEIGTPPMHEDAPAPPPEAQGKEEAPEMTKDVQTYVEYYTMPSASKPGEPLGPPPPPPGEHTRKAAISSLKAVSKVSAAAFNDADCRGVARDILRVIGSGDGTLEDAASIRVLLDEILPPSKKEKVVASFNRILEHPSSPKERELAESAATAMKRDQSDRAPNH